MNLKRFIFYQSLFIFFLSQSAILFAQSSKRVLFLGNSYTYANNLPQLIADAALSVNDTLIFDFHTPGGYTLLQHSNNTISQSKIILGGWDHVVLQGQSQEAILQESNFYTGMTNLNTLIKQHNPCAEPLFYMTWGRKNGDALNCPNVPIMCTYEGMDTTIRRDYLILAEQLRTEVSPVSVVWKYLRYNYPSLDLYDVDGSHPSAEGSYAAACCFYTSIFKKDPSLISYNFSLSPADAAIIRSAVKLKVFDSLSLWDYKKMPVSGFKYKIGFGLNEMVFTNTSQHADAYFWDFGDGTTSNLKSPSHSYASNGAYTASLTASNCDLQGTHTSMIDTVFSFCIHTSSILPDTLRLCPSSSDTLWTQASNSYQWLNNGIPIPNATNQYLMVSRFGNFFPDFPNPSVLTTNAGCSELSKPSYVESSGWQGLIGILSFNAIGNVLSGDSVCDGDTLKLQTFFWLDHVTQWYKNGIAIPFANSDTLITTTSGNYKVKVTHPYCSIYTASSDSLHYEFFNCALGVKENNLLLFEQMYPNPATETLTIKLKNKAQQQPLQIFNSIGILFMEIQADGSIVIDISEFPKGIYTIHLKNQKESRRFIKV